MENFKVRFSWGLVKRETFASGRLTDFKGRSRRSEFWVVHVGCNNSQYHFGLIRGFPLQQSQIVSYHHLAMQCLVSVHICHDTGKVASGFMSVLADIAYSRIFTFSGIANENDPR